MKVLITAGGTREPIDEVRVLTNISTGKLGADIANIFHTSRRTEKTYYICSRNSKLPIRDEKNIEIIYADSTQEVYDAMKEIVPKVDVVIHSMAVSDFGFKSENVKLKSNDPHAFIDSLRERIFVTPKIISHIKEWNSEVTLVGFKFEVNKSHEELIDIAYESLVKNKCDFVIANDKQEMKENSEHIAYIVDKHKDTVMCMGKLDIATKLLNLIK